MELFKLFGKIAVDNDEANGSIDETTGKAEKSGGKMNDSFKKIGLAIVGAFAIDKIIDFGKEIVGLSAKVNAEKSAFTQIMGDYSSVAEGKLAEVAKSVGAVDTRIKPFMTSMTAKFKGLGYDIEDSTDLASRGLMLASDASAFWDKTTEEAMGSLNSFINGSYEGGEAIGLFANDSQLASYAVKEGLVSETKEWSNLDEAKKQATRLSYAEDMMKASGAVGQASKEAGQYANVQANLNEKWRQFKAELGDPILNNIVLPAMDRLSGFVDVASKKFEALKIWVAEVKPKLQELGDYASGKFKPIMDDLNKVIDIMKDGFNVAKDKVQALIAEFSNGVGPIATAKTAIDNIATAYKDLKKFVGEVVDNLKLAKQWMKENETAVITLAIGFGSLTTAITLYNISQGIKKAGGVVELVQLGLLQIQIWGLTIAEKAHTIATVIATGATTAFGAVLAFITSPITLVVLAIGALIAIAVLLYRNWDTISAKGREVWNGIKTSITNAVNGAKEVVSRVFGNIKTAISNSIDGAKANVDRVFDGIKNKITGTIETARDKVKGAIDKIKSFFNFSWSLPKLKMPHMSISGKFSIAPPSVPSFGIDWYAKGGIMTGPTMFDYNPTTGRAKVGGEAGPEAIAPISTLMNYVRSAVQEENNGVAESVNRLISMLSSYFPQVIDGMGRDIVLNDGALVGRLAPAIDMELGRIYKGKGRGR